MKIYRLLSSLLAAVLSVFLFSGCGSSKEEPQTQKMAQAQIESNAEERAAAPAVTSDTVIHFFGSAVCSSCKEAEVYFESSAGKSRLLNARIVYYELLNSRGQMHKTNMKTLIKMLEDIKEIRGEEPFIIRDRQPHEYYQKNGIPYHRREESYSRRDEPLSVPVFIVNQSVYVGYNQHVVSELAKAVR